MMLMHEIYALKVPIETNSQNNLILVVISSAT